MAEINILSFDEFRRVLSDTLGIAEAALTPGAHFLNDLAIDSLKLVELMLQIGRLGVNVPSDAAWEIQTVGDAYNYYVSHITSANSGAVLLRPFKAELAEDQQAMGRNT